MKWIDIRDEGVTPSGKTKRYTVVTKMAPPTVLGRVQWRPGWRCYVFEPSFLTVFEPDCLRDIADFIEDLTLERGKAKLKLGT